MLRPRAQVDQQERQSSEEARETASALNEAVRQLRVAYKGAEEALLTEHSERRAAEQAAAAALQDVSGAAERGLDELRAELEKRTEREQALWARLQAQHAQLEELEEKHAAFEAASAASLDEVKDTLRATGEALHEERAAREQAEAAAAAERERAADALRAAVAQARQLAEQGRAALEQVLRTEIKARMLNDKQLEGQIGRARSDAEAAQRGLGGDLGQLAGAWNGKLQETTRELARLSARLIEQVEVQEQRQQKVNASHKVEMQRSYDELTRTRGALDGVARASDGNRQALEELTEVLMGEVEKGAHALAEEVAARRRAEQLAAVAMADARRSCAEALLLSVDAHAQHDERAQEARAGMRSLSERVEAVAGAARAEAAAAAARVGERLEAVHAEQERAQELQLLERSARLDDAAQLRAQALAHNEALWRECKQLSSRQLQLQHRLEDQRALAESALGKHETRWREELQQSLDLLDSVFDERLEAAVNAEAFAREQKTSELEKDWRDALDALEGMVYEQGSAQQRAADDGREAAERHAEVQLCVQGLLATLERDEEVRERQQLALRQAAAERSTQARSASLEARLKETEGAAQREAEERARADEAAAASLAELGRSVDATQAELGGLRVSHAAQLQAEREQRTVMYAEMEANMAAEDTVQRLIETLEVEEADAMRERQLEELSHLLTGEYFASHKETLETLGALAERKETELRVKLAQ